MSETNFIELSLGDPQWDRALPVLQSLRPHLDRAKLDQLLSEGAPQGLRFTAVFQADTCYAIAAWRVMASTTAVRRFYVDAIVTAPEHRNQGHGTRLFRMLVGRAKELRCDTVELNAAVDRFDTHRFLLKERMEITAHHFRLALS